MTEKIYIQENTVDIRNTRDNLWRSKSRKKTKGHKLTPLEHMGRNPKWPELYERILGMEIGETEFLKRKEWEKSPYQNKNFKAWWCGVKNQKRERRSRLGILNLEVTSYQEGWTIKRLK